MHGNEPHRTERDSWMNRVVALWLYTGAGRRTAEVAQHTTRRTATPDPRVSWYVIRIKPVERYEEFSPQMHTGNLAVEHVWGKRPSGTWELHAWRVDPQAVHVDVRGCMHTRDARVRAVLRQVRGRIMRVPGRTTVFYVRPHLQGRAVR